MHSDSPDRRLIPIPHPPPYSSQDDPEPDTDPPVIMGPNDHDPAPYDSFLCHSPPANSCIVVETSNAEYTLLVRLPGFRRDAITLATKRRRILHVVADSWEPEGGHFERRISFGCDADLAQVRAEFDGETLRIVVPRRASPILTASINP